MKIKNGHKPKVLFVGSFLEAAKDGSVGGQMFACRTLVQSCLGEEVDFILVDSTAESVPAPGFLKRLWLAFKRFGLFFYWLVSRKPDATLVFSSAGFSFIEKGLMILVSRLFCSNVIMAPRSGLLLDNIKGSIFFKLYARFVFRSAHCVICQGVFWKEYFTRLTGQRYADKMLVVPNWIDANRYSADQPQMTSSVKIAFIGWLETYKGIQDLIEAVKIVRKKMVPFELHVYGDGRLKSWLQLAIESDFRDGSVKYNGWITGDQKVNAVREADVIVLPSHREGFPNALLEAMVCQKAVIASAIGVVPEIIHHQVNGLLFTSGSTEDLAEKISLIIGQPELRMNMAIRARETVIEKYSIESAVATFRTIFEVY